MGQFFRKIEIESIRERKLNAFDIMQQEKRFYLSEESTKTTFMDQEMAEVSIANFNAPKKSYFKIEVMDF